MIRFVRDLAYTFIIHLGDLGYRIEEARELFRLETHGIGRLRLRERTNQLVEEQLLENIDIILSSKPSLQDFVPPCTCLLFNVSFRKNLPSLPITVWRPFPRRRSFT